MSGVFGLSDVRTEQIDRTWPEFTNYGYFVGGASPTGYAESRICLLYTSPSPRDVEESRMPSSA